MMLRISTCLLLLSGSWVSLAASYPRNFNQERDNVGSTAFSIHAEPRGFQSFDLDYSRYLTHLKYKATVPEELRKAVEGSPQFRRLKRDQGTSIVASPAEEGSEFYAPVSIGTPGQTLSLNFDTGSSDFWVFSSELTSQYYSFQKLYRPAQSSTAKSLPGLKWNISYADGSSCNGDVYTDVVTIGGIMIPNTTIECAKEVSRSFSGDTSIHGIVGMAFDRLNSVRPRGNTTSFLTSMTAALQEPVFTADLKDNARGTYGFGQINHSLYSGNLSYVPVDPSLKYWTFNISSYAVGNGSTTQGNISGLADTGTTLFYMPSTVVKEYYDQMPGSTKSKSGSWYADCKTTFKSFSFGVGSVTITIPGQYMNYGESSNGLCMGGMQSSDSVGLNIFGDVALKSAFVVFDNASPPRIGWANKPLKT